MKTVVNVKAHVDVLLNQNWLYFMRGDEVVRIDAETIEEAAKYYGVSVEFIEMMHDATQDIANDIIHELHQDLEDIWNKIEGLT